MSVLHDWDRIHRSGLRNRGLSLLFYCLSKKYPIFKIIKRIRENHDRVEYEQLQYVETLIKLNKIIGIKSIFGIRPLIMDHFPVVELLERYNVDYRMHVHRGEYPDPDRERAWIPALNQTHNSWNYDRDYINGVRVKLNDDELPVWHVDRPENLRYYIDWLYETHARAKGMD